MHRGRALRDLSYRLCHLVHLPGPVLRVSILPLLRWVRCASVRNKGASSRSGFAPGIVGLGKNRSIGNNLSPPIKTLSDFLNDEATIPWSIFTVKYTYR